MPKNEKKRHNIDYQLVIVMSFFVYLISCSTNTGNYRNNESPAELNYWKDIEVKRTNMDFTLIYNKDSIRRVLSFRKHQDTTPFQIINYQTSYIQKTSLKNEIAFIDQLWSLAEDSIKISPKWLMVGYPLEYQDILANQINALKDVRSLDINNYDTLRKRMLQNHVYEPVETYLGSKGLRVTKISTEKHGFVPQEDLKKLGFPDSLKIPIPFMVWLELEPN